MSGYPALHLAGYRLRLGDLLRLQALALQHVLEIHISTEVELVRTAQYKAPVFEQTSQDPVGNRRTQLALDVIADNRDTGFLEPLGPYRVTGNKDWYGIDEADLSLQAGFSVMFLRRIRTHG